MMEEKESGVEKRRMRSKAERREIVEETFEPEASVARVARTHGINANQLFQWRKLYREGQLEEDSDTLLPVKVTGPPQAEQVTRRRRSRAAKAAAIDIDLGHARVRIEGAADPKCVRAALESLVR